MWLIVVRGGVYPTVHKRLRTDGAAVKLDRMSDTLAVFVYNLGAKIYLMLCNLPCTSKGLGLE